MTQLGCSCMDTSFYVRPRQYTTPRSNVDLSSAGRTFQGHLFEGRIFHRSNLALPELP